MPPKSDFARSPAWVKHVLVLVSMLLCRWFAAKLTMRELRESVTECHCGCSLCVHILVWTIHHESRSWWDSKVCIIYIIIKLYVKANSVTKLSGTIQLTTSEVSVGAGSRTIEGLKHHFGVLMGTVDFNNRKIRGNTGCKYDIGWLVNINGYYMVNDG